MDLILFVSLVAAFATLATAHVAIGAGLFVREPWWRGALALCVPPLAPYWAFREKMHARAIVWVVAALGYAALRVMVVAVRE